MKKDIEWLKDEILTDMRYLEGNREIQQLDIKYQTLREVAQKINSLDEPETLSQDWIVDNVSFIQAGRGYVLGSRLQNLLVPRTVEKEQKYYVRENNYLLCKWKNEVMDYVEAVGREITDLVELKLTEQEIEDYDPRYWAFRKPVEELEE